ncbi:hypothetical protein Scep_024180 [Stephania cephalantha]|uniref:Uncharacterized protein n=1 Tax=Stephania cephalantha TaxID=152367 RepID=A0AAP0EW29_9MAGN
MDWGFVHRTWERWVFPNVGSFGEPLKASFLFNYDPTGPSRLLSESVMKVPRSGVNVPTPYQALTLLAAVVVDCPRCPVKYVMRLQMMP